MEDAIGSVRSCFSYLFTYIFSRATFSQQARVSTREERRWRLTAPERLRLCGPLGWPTILVIPQPDRKRTNINIQVCTYLIWALWDARGPYPEGPMTYYSRTLPHRHQGVTMLKGRLAPPTGARHTAKSSLRRRAPTGPPGGSLTRSGSILSTTDPGIYLSSSKLKVVDPPLAIIGGRKSQPLAEHKRSG